MENRTSHEQKHHGGNFVLTFDTLDLSKMQYPVQQRCNWNSFFFYRWIDANAVRFAVCVIESEKKWSWTRHLPKCHAKKCRFVPCDFLTTFLTGWCQRFRITVCESTFVIGTELEQRCHTFPVHMSFALEDEYLLHSIISISVCSEGTTLFPRFRHASVQGLSNWSTLVILFTSFKYGVG